MSGFQLGFAKTYRWHGLEDNLEYFERIGIARIHEVGEGQAFQLDVVTVRPFKMAQPGLTAYVLERESRRLVFAVDDTKDWKPKHRVFGPRPPRARNRMVRTRPRGASHRCPIGLL